ncbi:NACHT domain-containing protein [Aspergillus affinis]|uniref:NACHT domain-containing protein n=1 Tax=Aspergillus affinis TaxID=1070780 RepID=UPI0022FE1753|nr:uncharacterized protein KD926_011610 [Aspergillus affinis]KAI9037821.1 hypothetical protein KD926_011610 [Aspergillus affinis]
MNSFKIGQAIILAGGTMAFCFWLYSRRALSQPAPHSEAKHGGACHSGPAPGAPTQSVRRLQGVCLRQVYPSSESKIETDIDIIAIHGLDTKSPDTWIWKTPETDVNWLQDLDMLPKRFPTARIFTCDWPANLLEESDFIQKRIEEFARLLLAGIKHRPPATNNHCEEKERPILFIASCLGGVILMKMLIMANQEYHSVKQATRGIIFLATPFRGTSFEDVARWAEPCLRAWASIKDRNVSNMLEQVKPTFELEELVRSFTTFCQENDLTQHVFTFYETGKSSLPRKIAPWLPGFLSQEQPLVDKVSATLDIVPHPIPLARSHVRMNKFYGPEDPEYVAVTGKLDLILCKIRQGRPIDRADTWIQNKRYSLKELEIERLSGDLLPMDRCYINLAIIEHSAENNSHGKGEYIARKASPFSLHARLKTETPDKAIKVTLPTLFESRKSKDAGVGKTTLCKKIVHDFTYKGMWRDLFDRVLWVPLRNLKREERRQLSAYKFGSLFHDEYFSQHAEGRNLAEELWSALRDTKSRKTLFILDGLDEVSQDLGEHMRTFFKELLGQPNVIITTRPYAILPHRTKDIDIDLELETIGFYPDQVKAYVEKAFTDPRTVGINRKTPAEIQSYLQEHPIIQGLVRIPVQLDALCFTWQGLHSEDIRPQTMTDVYKAIEQSLWKKDTIKLDKRTEAQMQNASTIDIMNCIGKELEFVEALAFTGMYNDVIEFERKHRDAVQKLFDPLDMNLSLDTILGRLSFLRTSDPSLKERDRTYHFLHLTFQEYFAAKYFVRQWKANGTLKCLVFSQPKKSGKLLETPIEFLQKLKYHVRYDIFWRFVTGLLGDEDDEEVRHFFEKIREAPLDILGPMHQRLLMHCLHEVQTAEIPFRKDLEQSLLDWLLFECKYRKDSYLAAEMEFAGPVLANALQSSSGATKKILLDSLGKRQGMRSNLIDPVGSCLGDDDSDVRGAAVQALKGLAGQATLPPDIIEAIAVRLGDDNSDIRHAAVQTLEELASQTVLLPDIIQAIAVQLEDNNWLAGQTVLPSDIIEAIAVRLGDNNLNVKGAAVQALERLADQTALSPDIIQAITLRLEDNNWYIRYATVQALERLAGQTILPPDIIEAIVARLGDDDSDVRHAAFQALEGLAGQAALPPDSLGQYLGLLYRVLLETSFQQPCSWIITEKVSYIALHDREVRLGSVQKQFMEAIQETQRALDAPPPYCIS